MAGGYSSVVILRCPREARASKDAPSRPSPFEAREACHRAGHFGPDPLARTSG